MRYFKKLIPSTKVIVANNQAVAFETADGMVGYYQTDNAQLAAAFESHMRANRFGISEITQQEYETEFVQKKSGAILRPPSRDEFSGPANLARLVSHGSNLASQSAAVAVVKDTAPGKPAEQKPLPPAAVSAPLPEQPTIAVPTKDTEHAPERPDFQPTVGKRKRAVRRAAPPE